MVRRILDFTWLAGETDLRMREFDSPVVAAINGPGVAAPAAFAPACDDCLVAEVPSMAAIFNKVGLNPSNMGVASLPECPAGRAGSLLILMAGNPVPAARSQAWVLTLTVEPEDPLVCEARAYCQRLLDGPPRGLRAAKRMLNNRRNMGLASAIEVKPQARPLPMTGQGHSESNRTCRVKRKSRFTGK
jgi:enoyl-CoA hydratase/carnithine racemase